MREPHLFEAEVPPYRFRVFYEQDKARFRVEVLAMDTGLFAAEWLEAKREPLSGIDAADMVVINCVAGRMLRDLEAPP